MELGSPAAALALLEIRLNILLPPEYQDVYESVQPVSMGSAGLTLGPDGRVAWDEIWKTFCDLAMAGGPPHRGTFLPPGPRAAIDAEPERHAAVVEEICRGVQMVTGLEVGESTTPGWVRVRCLSDTMAGWLLRAVIMENVAARADRATLELPAGPSFRLEKEIKNVVTTMAKTCHYWVGHMPPTQQRNIGHLLAGLEEESPLVVPAAGTEADGLTSESAVAADMADAILQHTGLRTADQRCSGWLGVQCPDVRAAVWMMRAMVVGNVLARREHTVLFVPVPAEWDRDGRHVVRTLARVHGLAAARGVVQAAASAPAATHPADGSAST